MKRHTSILFTAASLVLGGQALAEGPEPFADFTFKRVKIPTSSTAKRITIQIDPNVQVFAKPKPQPKEVPSEEEPSEQGREPDVAAGGLYDWYWASVSPSLADSGPGRLDGAVNSLSNGPDGASVATPRLQDMQDIAARYGTDILKATIGTSVSPALVLALIGVESSGRSDAISSAGASGLMQLMPATAARFGVSDVTIPTENIRGGVAYLDWLMKEFDGDPVLILAAYNAGENSVKQYEGVPPYPETRNYVPKVLAAWTVARGLCLTLPELISDGCVFVAAGTNTNG